MLILFSRLTLPAFLMVLTILFLRASLYIIFLLLFHLLEQNMISPYSLIGKIDRSLFHCVTKDIVSNEVVMTATQMLHIQEQHPGVYEHYYSYFKEAVQDPDIILASGYPNTAVILKKTRSDIGLLIVLRLVTSSDPPNYKNSIITSMQINSKRWNRYLRTKKVLYKRMVD